MASHPLDGPAAWRKAASPACVRCCGTGQVYRTKCEPAGWVAIFERCGCVKLVAEAKVILFTK